MRPALAEIRFASLASVYERKEAQKAAEAIRSQLLKRVSQAYAARKAIQPGRVR